MHFFSSRNSSSRIFSYGNTEYATKVAHLFAQTFPSVFRRGIFTSADFFRLINFSSIVHTYIFVSACFRTYSRQHLKPSTSDRPGRSYTRLCGVSTTSAAMRQDFKTPRDLIL